MEVGPNYLWCNAFETRNCERKWIREAGLKFCSAPFIWALVPLYSQPCNPNYLPFNNASYSYSSVHAYKLECTSLSRAEMWPEGGSKERGGRYNWSRGLSFWKLGRGGGDWLKPPWPKISNEHWIHTVVFGVSVKEKNNFVFDIFSSKQFCCYPALFLQVSDGGFGPHPRLLDHGSLSPKRAIRWDFGGEEARAVQRLWHFTPRFNTTPSYSTVKRTSFTHTNLPLSGICNQHFSDLSSHSQRALPIDNRKAKKEVGLSAMGDETSSDVLSAVAHFTSVNFFVNVGFSQWVVL